MNHVISNFDDLAISKSRIDALSVIEEGYKAIDTKMVVENNFSIKEGVLLIKGNEYILSQYERIVVIGFGKSSCRAAQVIENVLGDYLNEGIVIDKNVSTCKIINAYQGSHPLPSHVNAEVSQKIADLAESLTEKDLAIVIVSGGGSALLCLPSSECEQGNELYNSFLKAGGNIQELNTLRKHISSIKGGGLAKMLYPATVASLIFGDVPGGHFEDVASGPTYFDITTISDAEELLKKYNIENIFSLTETPKDQKYFSKIKNIPFVSNEESLLAMEKEGHKLGYEVISLGSEMYYDSKTFLEKAYNLLKPKSIVMAGGEVSIALTNGGGVGGRNMYTASEALSTISDGDTFISFATDGIDNRSIAAGAIVDYSTKNKLQDKNIDSNIYHKQDNDNEMFLNIGDAIITGATGSNVSDLYLIMRN